MGHEGGLAKVLTLCIVGEELSAFAKTITRGKVENFSISSSVRA